MLYVKPFNLNFETVYEWYGREWCSECIHCLVFQNLSKYRFEIIIKRHPTHDQKTECFYFSSQCHFKIQYIHSIHCVLCNELSSGRREWPEVSPGHLGAQQDLDIMRYASDVNMWRDRGVRKGVTRFFLQVFKVFPHPLAYPSRHFKIPVYASGERPYLVDQTSEHFVEPSYDHYQSLMWGCFCIIAKIWSINWFSYNKIFVSSQINWSKKSGHDPHNIEGYNTG